MTISPELDRFLATMEYPATKDDLLREASRDGLGENASAALSALPSQNFSARWQIRYHLARVTGPRRSERHRQLVDAW